MPEATLVHPILRSPNGRFYRGGVNTAWGSRHREIIVGGPYGTGKSLGLEEKFYALNLKYPNCRSLMLRKEQKALMTSGYLTLRDKIIKNDVQRYPLGHPKCPVKAHGGIVSPDHIILPNGSEIYFRGLDDPTKVLSSEYDFAYVCQAEELLLEDWLQLLGRLAGRGGNSPYSQVLADCNPDSPNHWIKNRDEILLLEQLHHHNPWLCDVKEDDPENPEFWNWRPEGEEYLSVLDSYDGVLYQRGRLGEWVAPSGMVFPTLQRKIHVIDGRGRKLPDDWLRFRSIDFGFVHPFVCQWWALDPDKNVLHMYREIYMTKRLVSEHVEQINKLSEGEHISFTVCDHDAEDIETLKRAGVWADPATKDVRMGMELLEERFRVDSEGNPKILFWSNALVEEDQELAKVYAPRRTIDSLINLVFPQKKTGTPKDEIPQRKHDDGFHAAYYAVVAIDSNQHMARDYHIDTFQVPTTDTRMSKNGKQARSW